MMKSFHFATLAILFAVTVGGFIYMNSGSDVHSTHLDGSDFKPGRIIDDAVMDNSGTMSTSQIKSFMKKKLQNMSGGCDVEGEEYFNGVKRKNYSSNNPAPFTCITYYYENPSTGENNYGKFEKNSDGSYKKTSSGDYVPVVKSGMKSSARIIRDAASEYDVNPQVLLVLLQKEQSLIGDDWPWKVQYRSATGYGCPDTADCDEEYYGFYNQVNQAARYFREFLDDTRGYNYYPPGWNDILYYPDTSCGSSEVYIENRATSALYNYTPYQPNQAALDNLYGAASGSGSECSTYGNRNFWRDFTEWFGSTTNNIPRTIRIEENHPAKVYLVWQGRYYHIGSAALLQALNLDDRTHKTVGQNELEQYEEGPRLGLRVKFNDDPEPVYQIDNRRLYHYPSREMYEDDYGYDDLSDVQRYPATLRNFFNGEGRMASVIRAHGEAAVYAVEGGKKRHIASLEALETQGEPVYSEQPSVKLSSGFVNSLVDGPPIPADDSILKASDTGKYYLFIDGTIYPISSSGFPAWSRPVSYSGASQALIEELPTGSSSELEVKLAFDNDYYFVMSGNLHKMSTETMNQWGFEPSNFVEVSSKVIERFDIKKPMSHLIRINDSTAVYKVTNGKYHHIATREAFDAYGYEFSEVISVDSLSVNQLDDGKSVVHAPGQLIRQAGESPVYIVTDEFKKRYIPSRELFESYNFSFDEVRSVNSMEGYTDLDPLTNLATHNDKIWLVDRGLKRLVDPQLLQASDYGWENKARTEILPRTFDQLKRSQDLTIYIRGIENPEYVFRVSDGEKRRYSSREAFENDHGDWNDIVQLSDSILDLLPTGDPIQ